MTSPLAEQEMLERAVNRVAHAIANYVRTEAHNLGVELYEQLEIRTEDEDLRRRIAAGLALTFTAMAEGRDVMIDPPKIVSGSPQELLNAELSGS